MASGGIVARGPPTAQDLRRMGCTLDCHSPILDSSFDDLLAKLERFEGVPNIVDLAPAK
jgi:hypothetical protein